jgi:uncharacterized protein YggE
MHRRSSFVTLVLACGLLPAVASGAAEQAEPRYVSVSGEGEVHAAPDRATVTLGIQAREPTLEAARVTANRVVAALLKVTRDLRIPESSVRSTRIGVNPEYSWNDARHERRLVGYDVQRQLIVDLRDLERLGELIEQSVTAGANLVGDPVLESSERADLERQALARAVDDARRNAAVLARALDASVGPPRSITTTAAGGRPVPMLPTRMAMAKATSAEAPETYQSGELTFTATVSATFDLVPGGAPPR